MKSVWLGGENRENPMKGTDYGDLEEVQGFALSAATASFFEALLTHCLT